MSNGPDDLHAIVAQAGLLDDRSLVLMRDDTFLLADRQGDLAPRRASRHGLYHEGTRFVSGFQISLYGLRPLLLSSGVRDDAGEVFVHETNADVLEQGQVVLARDTIHVLRRMTVEPACCRIELRFTSFAPAPLSCGVELRVAADFADIFEVRGATRAAHGTPKDIACDEHTIGFGYVGLDGRLRTTRVGVSPPCIVANAGARWVLTLAPREPSVLQIRIACDVEVLPGARPRIRPLEDASPAGARISSTSRGFDAWVKHASADLRMLTARTEHGPYPYAGVPWFATPFGRDGIITALQTLWRDPALARGVLYFLAAHQCEAVAPDVDGEPGKILHEMRCGEMADLGEIPFRRYYGTVDATPLYLMLASAYHARTGDDATLRALWPNLERALAWLEGAGDPDGDGFVEYTQRSPDGLTNQGWKDSRDSVMHADGHLAKGPIALCEVQGYAYSARLGMARLARRLGHEALATRLEQDAATLKRRFAEAFWCEEIGTFAIALDGDKRPCRVRSSNAGHALWTGIALPEHAAVVTRTLLAPDHWSGWGVRTLARSEARYNPMSYHNGSVWPHDNAILAAGFARYAEIDAAQAVFASLFDASRSFERARLPELFCGFARAGGESPTLYPVACSPQAWSSGAVFQLLEASLGLSIDAAQRRILLNRPALPPFLREVEIRQLPVGGATIDLRVERDDGTAHARVLSRSGPVDLVVAS